MIISMTGFGKASKTMKNMKVNIELRSINSKYLEVSSRLPAVFSDKENELKEIIGKVLTRGKINVLISIDKNSANNLSLQIQPEIVKDYYNLLNQIKKTINVKEDIKLEHILKFSEIFKADDNSTQLEYWEDVKKTISKSFGRPLQDEEHRRQSSGKRYICKSERDGKKA